MSKGSPHKGMGSMTVPLELLQAPWRDRSGRFSPSRAVVFALLLEAFRHWALWGR